MTSSCLDVAAVVSVAVAQVMLLRDTSGRTAVASVSAAATEDAQQEQEQVQEVEIQHQRAKDAEAADDRFAARSNLGVGRPAHDLLGIRRRQGSKDRDANQADNQVQPAAAHEDV